MPKTYKYDCDYCGASFEKDRMKVYEQVFCSREHARLGQRKGHADPYSLSGPYQSMEVCAHCGEEYVSNHPQRKYCSKNCTKNAGYRRIKARYEELGVVPDGLHKRTRSQYKLALLQAQPECAICKIDLKSLPPRQINVDHCHTTGQTRELLCFNCNTGLGQFKESTEALQSAIKYLERHREENSNG